MHVEPGQTIKEGVLLAEIQSTKGEVIEKLHSVHPGLVLGYTDSATASVGEEIIALANFE